MKAWENARKSGVLPSVEVLLQALEAQKRSRDWTKEGGQFVPLPATYLNQHRWEDERPVQNGGAKQQQLLPGPAPPPPRHELSGDEMLRVNSARIDLQDLLTELYVGKRIDRPTYDEWMVRSDKPGATSQDLRAIEQEARGKWA